MSVDTSMENESLASPTSWRLRSRPRIALWGVLLIVPLAIGLAWGAYFHDSAYVTLRYGAHLAVLGGGKGEQIIESSVDPVQTQVKQVVEAIFTPAHTDPLEALLNEPFAGAFDQATANR